MKTSPRAYDQIYLDDACDILGHAFDWVVNTCGEIIQDFADLFAKSHIGYLFSIGTPKYVTGGSGAELANAVMVDKGLPEYPQEPVFYADKSPEYWTGYILAGYQWYSARTFHEIVQKIPMDNLMALYKLGHEMDEYKVFEILDGWMNSSESRTK